jgi:3-isopropylmalate dehydrogenase
LKRERIEGTDLVENLLAEFIFEKGRKDGGETAYDTCTYTRAKCSLAKKGFELAMTRTKKYVV